MFCTTVPLSSYLELSAESRKELMWNDEDENVGILGGFEKIGNRYHVLGKLITWTEARRHQNWIAERWQILRAIS